MKITELKRIAKICTELGIKRLKTVDYELEFTDSTKPQVGVQDLTTGPKAVTLTPAQMEAHLKRDMPDLDSWKYMHTKLPAAGVELKIGEPLIPSKEEISDEDMLFWSSPIQFDEAPQDPSQVSPAV